MKAAFADDVFAVVDLETTGTQRLQHDRIIQFGCAIIKHRQVVKTYSFLINPHRSIPQAVQNLTGISNAEVAHKRDFRYFAKRIRRILQGTIFVAHNVNFDLPFLNYELTNAGLDPLPNRAIDTVELAQIVFPTYPSYKLRDLTARLNIKHLNPHRADSDALVTAELLLEIINRVEQLPQATLNTLSALSKGLVRDTSYIFQEISQVARLQKRPLGKDFQQIHNLVVRRQSEQVGQSQAASARFPQSDRQKKAMFKGHVRYRRAQVKLINRLHGFLTDQKQHDLLVEAPNGTGKTFAYLFAAAYELYQGHKLVIAAPTKVLQEQLIKAEIPQMLQVTGLDLSAQLVKASSHYLDLDGFANSLYPTDANKPTLILQMGILIWLTQTKTGDLDELQLTNFQAPLFAQIQHPGDARTGTAFSEVDFWNLARYRAEQADILVTNQAYLANHYGDMIWGSNPILVIDEAHRFVDSVASSRNDQLHLESLWGSLSHLRNTFYFGESNLSDRFGADLEISLPLQKLEPAIINTIHSINRLQKQLYSHRRQALSRNQLANDTIVLSFDGVDLFDQPAAYHRLFKDLQAKMNTVRQLLTQCLDALYGEKENWLSDDESLTKDLSQQLDRLDYYAQQIYLLADQTSNRQELAKRGFILNITNAGDPLSTNISWLMLDPREEIKRIYARFQQRLFVSATLANQGDFSFAKQELALPAKTQTYLSQASFDLTKRLHVLAISDQQIPVDPNQSEFDNFCARFLRKLPLNAQHILVLFTNLKTIQTVFDQIASDQHFKDYEVLAQGITGSNERIAKRFAIAKRSILLGANTFWEGVDFQHAQVDLAIATKLPFDSPEQPEVKLRQKKLRLQGQDQFKADLLPRAILKLRQGCGRLIRGEHDHGVYILLDQRLWHRNYGPIFLENLPVKTEKVNLKGAEKILSKDLKS
ncbi:MAG: DEAD/DEAH box helicase [Lactobacillus sp.]|jgi:ATP-dependent DNA helicase DinG|nr:DEAD/DEAH box helicase [Lactobacillus sp.]MCI1481615.1 DEAD/DEAH box helicase [Lactobacillus sp.]